MKADATANLAACVAREDGSVAIPLRAGGEICAWAIVDAEDTALGTERWSLVGRGYASAGRAGLRVYMHRVVLGLVTGDGLQADHINHDLLDNRRANLRIVSCAQNHQNRLAHKAGASRYRGVSRAHDGRWVAAATINGVRHYLGRHATEIEAALLVDAFRREHMPFALPDPALAEAEMAVAA